ncbi:MAG: AbrB/MazE/SpoVT family DNA-binding domain-containing protein [Nanoarchaeota archaeon]
MITKTIKVTNKGQISIPSSIREIIGIQKGDELIIIENKGRILIEKVNNVNQNIIDNFSDMIELNQKSLLDVWDNEEDDIWNKYLENKIS